MKLTVSNDGELRATIRVTWRIDANIVNWLTERVGKREAEIALRRGLQCYGDDMLYWRRFAYNPTDKHLTTIPADDADGAKRDGYEVCED